MLLATYKNAVRTIFRSALFWFAVILVLVIVVQNALQVHSTRALVENDTLVGQINDKEEEFRQYMTHNFYVQTVLNTQCAALMVYVMPLFAVITTTLILSRDHGDGFFEIEKAAGVKAIHHFLGRISAIFTVNILGGLIFGLISLHTYFFTRGGPPDFFNYVMEYLGDSSVRILRIFFCASILAVAFYISVTYMVGSLLISGFAGAVVGFASVLFTVAACSFLRMRLPTFFTDYLSPYSINFCSFWGTYDSDLFTHPANTFKTSDVLIYTGIFTGISILFLTFSYFQTKRRNI